jgi:uncharacterized glyoxalase superfamily protein PhnB
MSSVASPATSMTHAIPCLRYTNAKPAIDWLVNTFGAEARQVFDAPDGTVAHSEVWFGSACVMIGTLKADNMRPSQPGQGCVYVVAADAAAVDALHARAVSAGATIVISLRDTDYGSHDFSCADPEGNVWSFGTYAPA